MRYISKIPSHLLYRNSGYVGYEFENGELIIGDPLTNVGVGNSINAAPIINNYEGTLQVLYPNEATDIERIGLNRTFWEAPPILSGAGTIAAGTRYQVIKGETIYDGVTYHQQETFIGKTGVTTTSGSGEYSLGIPSPYANEKPAQFYQEWFKIVHLGTGDEATFKIQGPQNVEGRPPDWIRP
jgi:hypothetical protein